MQEPRYGSWALCCDACGVRLNGEIAGRGLLLFTRGDQVDQEEPPLCERCSHAIGLTALFQRLGSE